MTPHKQVMLATPRELFEELDAEFGFEVDLAASDEFHLCDTYYTEEYNAFDHEWDRTSWCSPPWTEGLGDWVYRAVGESRMWNSVIVMLLPLRPDAPWWMFSTCAEVRMLDPQPQFVPMEDGVDVQTLNIEEACVWVVRRRPPSTTAPPAE